MDRFFALVGSQPEPVVGDAVAAIVDAFLDWTHRNRDVRTYAWYRQRLQWFLDALPMVHPPPLIAGCHHQWIAFRATRPR
jgi:hypothetical protein